MVTSKLPNCEQQWGGAGWVGLAGCPAPQCIILPGRNSCRTLCSQTADLLGPSGLCSGQGSRPKQGLEEPPPATGLATAPQSCLPSSRHPPPAGARAPPGPLPLSNLEIRPSPAGQAVVTLAGGLRCRQCRPLSITETTQPASPHQDPPPTARAQPPHGNLLGTVWGHSLDSEQWELST